MATLKRIERRRKELRNGHSVRCWKSKWSTCKCKVSGARPGEDKGRGWIVD